MYWCAILLVGTTTALGKWTQSENDDFIPDLFRILFTLDAASMMLAACVEQILVASRLVLVPSTKVTIFPYSYWTSNHW